MRVRKPATFKIVGGCDRASRVPRGVRARPACPGTCGFLAGEQAEAAAPGLAADVLFDGNLAGQAAAQIADRRPDRRVGTVGDRGMAAEVARQLARRGFHVERRRFTSDGEEMVNVIGRRAGRSQRQIAIVAARDAATVPDAIGSAADTAALLEFARVFEGRPTRKTLCSPRSTGRREGDVGAEKLEDRLGDPARSTRRS